MSEIIKVFFSNAFAKLATLFTLPIYAAYLSLEQIGWFDFYLTAVLICDIILPLKIQEAVVRFSVSANFEIRKSIVSSAIFLVLKIYFPLLLLSILINIPILTIVILYSFTRTIFTTMNEFCRAIGKTNIYSTALNLTTFVSVALVVSCFKLDIISNVDEIFYIMIFVYFSTSILLTLQLSQYISFASSNLDILKNMVYFSLPLVPSALSWWVIKFASRHFLMIHGGAGIVGQFALLNFLPTAIISIGSVFYIALQKKIFLLHEASLGSKVKLIISMYIRYTFFAVMLIMIASSWINQLLFPKFNTDDYMIVALLITSTFFFNVSSIIALEFTMRSETKLLFLTTLVSAAVTIVMMSVLGKHQLLGVAFSTMIGTMSLFLSRLVLIKVKYCIQYEGSISYAFLLIISMILLSLSGFVYLGTLFLVVIAALPFYVLQDVKSFYQNMTLYK